MPLTDIEARSAKPKEKQYKIADGEGMYLLVMPTGRKYWKMKYHYGGKEKLLSIGVYPDISISVARQKRAEAKQRLTDGTDPSEAKQAIKRQKKQPSGITFKEIAIEWHNNKKENLSELYAKYIIDRLEYDIFKPLGNRPLKEITAPELLAVMRDIEARGIGDIPHRLLQYCGQIFRFAIATGRGERDLSADLQGALKAVKKEHHAHLLEKDLPDFLKKLANYEGSEQTKLAWKFMLLTFVRTTELRGAEWQEIDFDKAEWRIPAERMKMRDPHIVPLARQTIEILNGLLPISGHRKHVFPNQNRPATFISENTLLYALYRMGYHSRATTHGFRASASTILNENGFRADVIERQLAHTERNAVRAAYNHAQYLPERREMMQWWADKIDSLRIA